MQLGERVSILARILLPLLVLLLLNIAPLPHRVTTGLSEARLAQEDGQHQLAAARLRSVLAVQLWRTGLWEQVGLLELAADRPAEALPALQKAHELGILSLEGQIALGDLYVLQGNPAAAQALWRSLLAANPLPQIYERLAHLYRQEGNAAALEDTLRAWRELEPENANLAYELGLSMVVKDPGEGLRLLMDAARLDPNVDDAVQVLRKAINQASVADDPGYGWVMVGRALGSLGEWSLAKEAFQQAVAVSPQYAEAWAFLGEAKFQTGESGEAELTKAHEINHQSTLVQALTALYWRRQGKLEQALSYLEAIARQEPDEPAWQVEMGHTLVEMGSLAKAQEYYVRAVELAPKTPFYWYALVRFSVNYKMDVQNLALPAARQALLLAPDDPVALDLMGWTMLHLEDTASAERFLQRAIHEDPGYSSAYLHLAQLYLQQQDLAKAFASLHKAIDLAEDENDPVRQTARRLLLQYFHEDG